jgi:hypothetical protein
MKKKQSKDESGSRKGREGPRDDYGDQGTTRIEEARMIVVLATIVATRGTG